MNKQEEYIWEIDLYTMDDVFVKERNYRTFVKNKFYIVKYRRSNKRETPSKIVKCQPQFDRYEIVSSNKTYTLHELILQNKIKNLGIPEFILNDLLIINKSILLNKPLNKKIVFSIEGEE